MRIGEGTFELLPDEALRAAVRRFEYWPSTENLKALSVEIRRCEAAFIASLPPPPDPLGILH